MTLPASPLHADFSLSLHKMFLSCFCIAGSDEPETNL